MKKKSLKELHLRYLTDSVLISLQEQMQNIYLSAMPIGLNSDGFIYSDIVNGNISMIKVMIRDHISANYEDLMYGD